MTDASIDGVLPLSDSPSPKDVKATGAAVAVGSRMIETFKVAGDKDIRLRNAYYFSRIDRTNIRPVKLACPQARSYPAYKMKGIS